MFDGEEFLLERAIKGNFALIKAKRGDKEGNLQFNLSARNFNPECAKAAAHVICEVEELVEQLDPNQIHLPGIFVHTVTVSKDTEKRIEKITTSGSNVKLDAIRERLARRAALEFEGK